MADERPVEGNPNLIRRKIRWATRKRKGSSRVWKTKWVTIHKGNKGK